MDIHLSQMKPIYPPPPNNRHIQDTPTITTTLTTLNLIPHIEGGFFAETDRDPRLVPNPHPPRPPPSDTAEEDKTRSASTSIIYLLTPRSPLGAFHRNASRTVHALHRGRGRYVILHADGESVRRNGGRAGVETFVVGCDVGRGEKLQWVVEGGRYKASFLLPDRDYEEGEESGAVLMEGSRIQS